MAIFEQDLVRGRARRAEKALDSYIADYEDLDISFKAFLLDFLYAAEWEEMDVSEEALIALIREVREKHSQEPKFDPEYVKID